MGQSYRIKTETGINKKITVQLDQEFEFLEILSLRIQQEDIYTRMCADYGVVVGRVTANNGFGIPNARLSVFIPIKSTDQSNPIITSIYPYKSISDKNEDGYRYNLLPYEKSYSKHAATGTLPSRGDVLTGKTAVEIYNEYYKFTVKTNESGDYMIMGVPVGTQTIFMDVDLSDIGEFSLTPQDLIRMGIATESQVAGNQFRSSNDLNSLPQIISLTKNIEVSPLWGDESVCQIAINRVDFDLRDEANINIQPTSVFIGSIFSSPDNFRVRNNCKPKDDLGNLCNLVAGPGQILSIRQTIQQDSLGNPILEVYQLEQSGNVIDGDGTWLVELPMNLDYFITNEFGEKVLSNDPTVGIPTKGKYRFKIKWQQPPTLTEQTRRAYFLVPNVKEYGWKNTTQDPNNPDSNPTNLQLKQLGGSYYFGLDWSGYTNQQSAIECEDTFYQFEYNRVYTISGLIDEYKNGDGRGKFIGIKEIDDDSCSSTINKFPVNEGFRNFDLIFFLFSIIFQVIQLIGLPILVIYHFLAFLWNNFAVIILPILIGLMFKNAAQEFYLAAAAALAATGSFGTTLSMVAPFVLKGVLWTVIGIAVLSKFKKIVQQKFGRIKLPMITYPECQACDCVPEETKSDNSTNPDASLSLLSNGGLYYNNMGTLVTSIGFDEDDADVVSSMFSTVMGTRGDEKKDNNIYKSMESPSSILPSKETLKMFAYSDYLPLAERINIFNTRAKYFNSQDNRISVTFDVQSNIGVNHYDNTITVLNQVKLEAGTLVTFVNPNLSKDVNYFYTSSTVNLGLVQGITGTPKNIGQNTYVVNYANTPSTNASVQYTLYTGSTITNYRFPADIEYYQVITAMTVNDFFKLSDTTDINKFPGILNSDTIISYNIQKSTLFIKSWPSSVNNVGPIKFSEYFEGFGEQYVTIFQRGVDPYSPKYVNKYGLGKLFGFSNENDIIITATTRVNIPIQNVTSSSISVQGYSQQSDIFYESHFFEAGNGYSAYTTSNVGYYGKLDAQSLVNNIATIGTSVVSSASNFLWDSTENPGKYSFSEDLSGAGYYYDTNGTSPSDKVITYYSPSLLPTLTANPMNMVSKVTNILRTDRLPSSDYLDSSSWEYNPSLLQQNTGFSVYVINTDDERYLSDSFGSGADTVSPNIQNQLYSQNVVDTVGTCSNMVGLSCYSGNGENFGVITDCNKNDTVQNGCYVLMERPLLDLTKDLKSFAEWGFRFRFFYGLCRGVLSQTFTNNWVNGSLYMFPIQVNTTFNSKNQVSSTIFCNDLVYFDTTTNNFYYRSSPYYSGSTQPFIGLPKTNGSVNDRNLLFPTTIINLGFKDSFYQEIIFEPSAKGYIIDRINPTSYGDTSDLVNLFVISRITDESFLKQIISAVNPNKNNSLNQLFTRPEKRIDGDLAQMLSINSEEGVIKFSPEYYQSTGQPTDPVVIFGPLSRPTMGIFFSSTTQDLQFKDYLTPGRIDFRNNNNILFPFNYGIKSQEVPFYKWELNTNNNIFGNELNNWATQTSDIFSYKYQSLDRTNLDLNNPSKYFIGSNTSINDTFARGYIFNVDAQTRDNYVYSKNYGQYSNKFLVGAPFHFYFGTIKGATALDKFKTKYSILE